ncbi:MAG: tRNA-dihydrouridine synthase family protein [Deltaproteobacteria bacterium]|nr:tRNA-dihydrouridine synthase family protein [Deltaproteobacteria bacterium]MBI3294993.1 tRNA-dihydrouridine synthase family protein [Deltaproteobacteria bacterium]
MNYPIQIGVPALVLAPMEGVTDAPMRALLTERGGFSLCVTEFLRVSEEVLPDRVILRKLAELASGGRTPSGCPVMLQLLGGDPEAMAHTARQAVALGALGIDINFGCPSKTVNRHEGGAALLKCPDKLGAVVRAVREAVPRAIPVSAKLRLGWERVEEIHHNAQVAAESGASWLTIHARTRAQGYAPPVNWRIVGEVRRALSIPVIVNGDIRDRESLVNCAEVTGAEHFMLGRGALANPDLARLLCRGALDDGKRTQLAERRALDKGDWTRLLDRGVLADSNSTYDGRVLANPVPERDLDLPMARDVRDRHYWLALIDRFCAVASDSPPETLVRRVKQWFNLAAKIGECEGFEAIKRLETLTQIRQVLLDAPLRT